MPLGAGPRLRPFYQPTSPEPNPKESSLFGGALLQAPGGEEPRALGVLPTRHFVRAGAQMPRRRLAAPSLPAWGRGGAWTTGPKRPGEGCPWAGGRGETSLSLKSAAGASAQRQVQPPGRCRGARSLAPTGRDSGTGRERGPPSRDRARTGNTSAQKKKKGAPEAAEWTAAE